MPLGSFYGGTMYIGIPKESRPFEYRVGLSPAGVEILTHFGHQVFVEHEAGAGAGFKDQDYEKAGARIAFSPQEVFGRADFLLKISRPQKQERRSRRLRMNRSPTHKADGWSCVHSV